MPVPIVWTAVDTLPTWTLTDLDILKRLQYSLMESLFNTNADGINFLTTRTSPAELTTFMNQRQQNFLYLTGAIVVRATAASVGGQPSYNYPSNKIHARSITWQAVDSSGNLTGKPKRLERTDAFALSLTEGDPPGRPRFFDDGSAQPTLEFRVSPVTSAAGQFRLMMVPQPVTLLGSGTALSIPDEMASALHFGVMADFLSSDGESLDADRAAFAESLYDLMVDVTCIMLGNDPPQRKQSDRAGSGAGGSSDNATAAPASASS